MKIVDQFHQLRTRLHVKIHLQRAACELVEIVHLAAPGFSRPRVLGNSRGQATHNKSRVKRLGSLVLVHLRHVGHGQRVRVYGLFAIVILATWRTSSWIGVDGLVAGYRQRHHHPRLSPQKSDLTGKRKMRAVLVSRLVDATKGLRGEEIHWFPADR